MRQHSGNFVIYRQFITVALRPTGWLFSFIRLLTQVRTTDFNNIICKKYLFFPFGTQNQQTKSLKKGFSSLTLIHTRGTIIFIIITRWGFVRKCGNYDRKTVQYGVG